MSLFSVPKETNHVALLSKRDVTLTMPWFSELSKYPPRAANVVNPLIKANARLARLMRRSKTPRNPST